MKTRTTESIISGKDVLQTIPAELARFWKGKKALIVADANTWKAAGQRVSRIIAESGFSSCEPYIFPVDRPLHTDTSRIAELSRALASSGAVVPVAVGSGTINDIVKRAAFERGLSYLCVPTAPSVDGYTSFGAAVTVANFKTTLPCDAPKSVVADEDIMAAAPYRLLAAGYGDLAAKLASGRDWIIASELGLETIDPAVWELSQGRLRERLANPERLAARDPRSVRNVFDGLCDTGLAMQDQGDSRPASGAEHHISHCLEMRGLSVNGDEVLHGEKVAAGTLLSVAMAEFVFSFDGKEVSGLVSRSPELNPADCEREVRSIFAGTGIASSAVDAAVHVSLEKLVTGKAREDRLGRICRVWDAMKKRAMENRPGCAELADMFSKAGCPSFSEIGLDAALASWALCAARTIRNRYTILDLARDLGIFEEGIGLVTTKTKYKGFNK